MANSWNNFSWFGLARIPARFWFGVGAILAALSAVAFWGWTSTPEVYPLRFGAREDMGFRSGSSGGAFHNAALKHGLKIETQPSQGGEDALHRVAKGELDVAIVLADSKIDDPDICQVAYLRGEPLQVFMKAEIAAGGLAELKGKCLNLGPQTGETHPIAERVLKHMGLKAGVDYLEENYTYKELLELPPDRFPDAIFCSAPLPWSLAPSLIKKFDLRLVEIPFGEALALRNSAIEDICIPAHTYSFSPAVPEKPLHTLATHRLLIANRNAPKKAIERLIEMFFDSDFARRTGKPPLDLATANKASQFPLHPGVLEYLRRNDPLIDRHLVQRVTDLRSFLVSAGSALVLLWGWYRRRNTEGLDRYFQEVSRWEIEAWQTACDGQLGEESRQALMDRLMQLKIDVLGKQHAGALACGEAQLAAFLARVEDARRSLDAMPTRQSYRPSAESGRRSSHHNAA